MAGPKAGPSREDTVISDAGDSGTHKLEVSGLVLFLEGSGPCDGSMLALLVFFHPTAVNYLTNIQYVSDGN